VVVGAGAIVAANAVVLDDTIVPPGALAVGTPAVVKRGKARSEEIGKGSAIYVAKGKHFREALREIMS
jgi:carbonic anhydrase/acetyltransferase-like protein (isoleucine patch superfamily)